MRKKILVTGASGQVGSEIQAIASEFAHFDFVFAKREDLDIRSLEEIEDFFHQHLPDYCINCAAYTAVDKAENDEENAYLLNATAVAYLAMNCKLQQVPLIHLSTDYVYNSAQPFPFKEDDQTNPSSVYASTKLEGDLLAQEIHPLTMVIRTSWVYSSFGHNFVKTMLRLGADRKEINVVFDQIGTPTYARDLAHTILTILTKVENNEIEKNALFGIFHYSNEGVTSWYDFAKAIFDEKNISCKVFPIETVQYPTPAQRPPFSVMNKTKIKEIFKIHIPHWQESLKEMLALV
jgi:dTDP-4-dehydrorhamnose reductase